MTIEQIHTIKYLQLKVKIAMKEDNLSVSDLAKKAKISIHVAQIALGNLNGLIYSLLFRSLMKIGLSLKAFNVMFDENEIVNLKLEYSIN